MRSDHLFDPAISLAEEARNLICDQTGHVASGPIRKMVTGVALFLTVCLIAVIGYMIAGWRLDSRDAEPQVVFRTQFQLLF